MCSPVVWWWILFSTILLAGAFGGYARYQWELSEGNGKEGAWVFIVTGVASSFLVPLFLNTISSSLIKDIPKEQEKLLILIGFSVAAGAFAKQFIGSVAKKALELSKQANQVAIEARQVAVAAGTEARSADNRALALHKVLNLVESAKYPEALVELKEVLAADPKNSEAHAWAAYCHKRLNDLKSAVNAMTTALLVEDREVHSWLYNLACYQALAGTPAEEVIATLERARRAATTAQLAGLAEDLRADADFDILRGVDIYESFVASLKKG